MVNAQKCIQFMEKKAATMEYRMVTVKGQKLSRSDVDSVILYAKEYMRSGGYSWGGFMEPMGAIKEVLAGFGLKVEKSFAWN